MPVIKKCSSKSSPAGDGCAGAGDLWENSFCMGRKGTFVLGVLCIALAASTALSGSAARLESVKGYVMEAPASNILRLFGGTTIEFTPSTRIRQGRKAYEGNFLVGQRIEAKGTLSSDGRTLLATEIKVRTHRQGKKDKGKAFVDAVRFEGGVRVAQADGRTLALPELKPPAGAQDKTGEGQHVEVRPGMFLEYEGRWDSAGVVQVKSYKVSPNDLEPKEAELYREFAPTTVFPASEATQGTYLVVGKGRFPLFPDPEMQLYLHRLGRRLLPAYLLPGATGDAGGKRFSFHVVSDSRPYAFAYPGGVVVVSTGMILTTENEAQLAFVLAHEIAHAVQEHAWMERKYHKSKLLFLRWATAGMGYVVESAIRQGYSRHLEDQADRWALVALVRAGIDPREAFGFMEEMESRQRGASALLWDSHSSYKNRREKLAVSLLHFSLQGLDYPNLLKNSANFDYWQRKIPAGEF